VQLLIDATELDRVGLLICGVLKHPCLCLLDSLSTYRCFLFPSLDIHFARISRQITAAKVIFYAAMRGKEELVKKCIAEGANVDECRDLVSEAGNVLISLFFPLDQTEYTLRIFLELMFLQVLNKF